MSYKQTIKELKDENRRLQNLLEKALKVMIEEHKKNKSLVLVKEGKKK